MKRNLPGALVLILLFLPTQTRAWNKTGHFVVASIAYDQLTPSTKCVSMPSSRSILIFRAQQGKVAFAKAAGWPGRHQG